MKVTLLLFVCAGFALAQNLVVISPGSGQQVVNAYNGSSQLTSKCAAYSFISTGARAATYASISAVTKASPAVITSTGHGFTLSTRPQVTISGATGTGWTAINGTFTATVIDANTFSIPVDSSAFGTLAGTVRFTTTAPRSTVPEWQVQLFFYDASGNQLSSVWLNGTSAYSSKCSDVSSTTLILQ